MATNDSDDSARALEHSAESETLGSKGESQDSSKLVSTGAVTGGSSAADVSTKARDLTSRVLDFLSNASNETLGACIVGLGAATWLILGRVGLVLIGIVGGVVLHATWEGGGQDQANDEARALEARRRREKGLDVAGRVLDWRGKTKAEKHSGELAHQSHKTLDFSGFQPETAAALTGLTDAVVRDYVKYVASGKDNERIKLTCLGGGTGPCFLLRKHSQVPVDRP